MIPHTPQCNDSPMPNMTWTALILPAIAEVLSPRGFFVLLLNSVLEQSTTVLLELPVSVVKRAHLSSLEPSRDAVEMESVLGVC